MTSAFKQLYTDILKGGNFANIEKNIPKKQIRCFIKESFPHFLVTDDYFYIPCYFTKKAVDEFKNQFSNVNITDLKSKTLVLKEWTMEVVKVDSASVFTSYAGIEIRLIVKSFKIEKGDASLTRYPLNLYRDDEIKTLIQSYLHGQVTSTVKAGCKTDSLPDMAKIATKGTVAQQGVVKFAQGDSFSNYGFTSGKTQVLELNNIFKMEKGAAAFSKLSAGGVSIKPKVSGSKVKVGKKSSAKKTLAVAAAAAEPIAKKLEKVADNKKKSTKRIPGSVGGMPTPGDKGSAGGTTGIKTMDQYKKMIAWYRKKSGTSKTPKKASKK
jgi:hypothetical protein